MTISRRAFLALLGLAPVALLPKVTLPEAPRPTVRWPTTPLTQEMADDIAPDFAAFRDAGYFHRFQSDDIDIEAASRSLDASANRIIAMLEQAAADGLVIE
mgnify:CR=1 FL=1